MKILFDPAVGINVGYGHLKRCEAIADELVRLSHEVDFLIPIKKFDCFINSEKFGIVRRIINKNKYNMIVIDKYDIDQRSLYSHKRMCDLLVRIDDASPRIIRDKISDVLINGNAYARKEMYGKNVKEDCIIIAGPDYIPMSKGFCNIRKKYKVRRDIRKILITFGGSALGDEHAQAICKSILETKLKFRILILSTKNWSIAQNVTSEVKFASFTDQIEQIFFDVDIAITSAGSTCWQLAAVGVPFVAYKIAPNQSLVFDYITQTNLGIALSSIPINENELIKTLNNLSYVKRNQLCKRARNLIDCGGSIRIAKLLHSMI